jgi:hypothetical protein
MPSVNGLCNLVATIYVNYNYFFKPKHRSDIYISPVILARRSRDKTNGVQVKFSGVTLR